MARSDPSLRLPEVAYHAFVEESTMGAATERRVAHGVQHIDCNLCWPAKEKQRKGSGAAALRYPRTRPACAASNVHLGGEVHRVNDAAHGGVTSCSLHGHVFIRSGSHQSLRGPLLEFFVVYNLHVGKGENIII